MKTKTKVRSGAAMNHHGRKLVVRSKVRAGGPNYNHNGRKI